MTGSPSGRIRPTRSESLTRWASIPWYLNHPSDPWHIVDAALRELVNKVVIFVLITYTIAVLPATSVNVSLHAAHSWMFLHCIAVRSFMTAIPQNPITSQVSSSAATARSRTTSFQKRRHSSLCCANFSNTPGQAGIILV